MNIDSAPTRTSLGDQIKARRLELGLTQVELAERAGLTQPTVSRIEVDGNIPSLRTVLKLRDALTPDDDEFAAWIQAAA